MLINDLFNIKKLQGFTLIELLFIILLISVVGVTLLLQWPATSLNLEYEARRVQNDIRYTQALSITSGQRYRWVKISSSTYQIVNEAGTPILLPSGSNQLTLINGVTLGTLSNLPNNLIAFNSQGIPYVDSTIPGTALTATASISINTTGQSRTIQISPETGYGTLQ
ncbi:MAG: hypothetical protein ACD_45C00750G0004 [uncultured bacterium]|nr:MAG: hypothetical protein ACD_45C00750G0004 [uncultured bacterium]